MGRLAQHEIRIYRNGRGKSIMTEPKPGSKEAIDEGCTCPIIDNHYGQGIVLEDSVLFYYNSDCPIHGLAEIFPWLKGGKDEV
jgi:hypothetical protein